MIAFWYVAAQSSNIFDFFSVSLVGFDWNRDISSIARIIVESTERG